MGNFINSYYNRYICSKCNLYIFLNYKIFRNEFFCDYCWYIHMTKVLEEYRCETLIPYNINKPYNIYERYNPYDPYNPTSS